MSKLSVLRNIAVFLLASFIMAGCTYSKEIPAPSGYVVDTIHLLKPETVQKLTEACTQFDSQAQIAVLIVDTTQPDSIEQYGIKVAEKWKVGYKGKDNGVILILAKDDHHVRIEVGRGLEGKLPDARAGQIVDLMTPSFKQSAWDKGVTDGVAAIMQEIKEPGSANLTPTNETIPWWFWLIIGGVVLLIKIIASEGGGIGGGGGSYSGGSSSGGSSSGGFGGGSFSGGGASGRW
jgi:uncharacterized protein